MKNFTIISNYEQEVVESFVKINHKVRILLNSNRKAIEEALRNIPYEAKVTMVIGDDDKSCIRNYGTIVFEEIKQN